MVEETFQIEKKDKNDLIGYTSQYNKDNLIEFQKIFLCWNDQGNVQGNICLYLTSPHCEKFKSLLPRQLLTLERLFSSTPHFPQKSQSNSEQQTSSLSVCSISFLVRLQMLDCTESNACAPYVALMVQGEREMCCFQHSMDDWNGRGSTNRRKFAYKFKTHFSGSVNLELAN